MSAELNNTNEDTEMADCDGEKVVTMMDVLQEQEDFEEDVNAVLGASDEKECTYAKGYIKRQAIYACMTCCTDAKDDPDKRAGVCLACSLACHENHDLIELYTKRNFKCDCGNPKFNSHPCQFTPNKTDLNEENNYNQNFSGVYCICQRPYPDPESQEDVVMIQCIICEDWLHTSHLEATVPDSDQYSEMICKNCMEKNEFLHDYGCFTVNVDVDVVTNGMDSDVMSNRDTKVDTIVNGDTKVDTIVNGDTKVDTIVNEDTAKEEDTQIKACDEISKSDENEIMNNINKSSDVNNDFETKADVVETSDTETPEDATLMDENVKEPSEVDNLEQHNDCKETATDANTTESNAELQNIESIKTAEHIPDVRLLPESDIDSLNLKTKEDDNITVKTEDERLLAESDDSKLKTEEEENIINNEPIGNDNQSDCKDNDDSTETMAEKQLDKTPTENETIESTSSSEDKTAVSEVEKKDELDKSNTSVQSDVQNSDAEIKTSEKRKLSPEDNTGSDCKKVKFIENESCARPKGVKKVHKGATFWPSTFRQKLCTCGECITMYTDLSVLFLIDSEDTVSAYESLGKEKANGKPVSQYEKGLEALSSLDRVQQINALTEYNNMRDRLLDFLRSFKERREVVREEDIKEFFATIKPKREHDGVYFCR